MESFRNNPKLEMSHMRYAQGLGASLRYATELRAVQQVGRLAPLRSSNLHEDVLRGNLGPTSVGMNIPFKMGSEWVDCDTKKSDLSI